MEIVLIGFHQNTGKRKSLAQRWPAVKSLGDDLTIVLDVIMEPF